MTPAQYNRMKFSKIASLAAYERLRKWIRNKNPNLPDHALLDPKDYFYKNTSHRQYLSKLLETIIITLLNKAGHIAKKVETRGIQVKTKKGPIWIPGGVKMTKGEPDVISTIKGRTVYWEVKVGKDSLGDEQKEFIERAREAGALVYVVKTVDDFFNIYEKKIAYL